MPTTTQLKMKPSRPSKEQTVEGFWKNGASIEGGGGLASVKSGESNLKYIAPERESARNYVGQAKTR